MIHKAMRRNEKETRNEEKITEKYTENNRKVIQLNDFIKKLQNNSLISFKKSIIYSFLSINIT